MDNGLTLVAPLDFLTKLSAKHRTELKSIARPCSFAKNEIVFGAGAMGRDVYILVEGRVKIYQLSDAGRNVILWFCFPGELFGLAETTHVRPREVHAQACSDSRVLVIDEKEFKKFLSTHSAAAMLVIDLLATRLRAAGEMLLNVSSDDVMTRLIKLITRLNVIYGKRIDREAYLDIHLTHQDMADMIGASRQTVTTTLGQLRRKGILRIEGRRLHIPDPALLESIAADHLLARIQ
jgi:CRP/FNR family transcriptional regulator